MKTHKPDTLQLLSERDPASPSGARLVLSPEERLELRERAWERAQVSGDRVEGNGGWHRGNALKLAAAGVIAATALTAILALGGAGGDSGPGLQFAAAAVRVAEVNPRILVTEPGWKVVHVEPLEPDSGETQFSDGTSEFDVTWYPARLYKSYLRDRSNVSTPVSTDVLGVSGTTVHYGGSDYATMLPPQGDVFIEMRGDLGSEDAYREVLDSLEATDINTWLSAMPDDVVQPNDQGPLVDSLLKGVPLPPGFDLAKLEDQAVLNREGIEIKVAEDVSCGWLDSWVRADNAGDEDAKAKAVNAMGSADQWPVMSTEPVARGRAKAIRDFADQISQGHLDQSYGTTVITTTAGGKSFAYGPAYAVILECDSMTKRPVATP